MKQEIFVNVLPHEVRAAVVENESLVEMHIEREHRHNLVGRIYKAKINRVMPGMQAAFVEFGQDKAGFLHLKDLKEFRAHDESHQGDAWVDQDIRKFMKQGDELFVQVQKNPIGSKGARLTTQLSLVSHYMVMIPNAEHVGVSLRIEDEAERERLVSVIESPQHGFIFRTMAVGVDAERLLEDQRFLEMSWQRLREKMKYAKVGECVHEDAGLLTKIVRDVAQHHCDAVYVDDQGSVSAMQEFAAEFVPDLKDRIRHHGSPIFDQYSIEKQLSRALMRQVPLASGGYIVIDQTEAMTVIDVNSGGYVGQKNLEATAYKINCEAARALVKQIRLRNIAGIIIVDFIDMQEQSHHNGLLDTLREELSYDTSKSRLSEVTSLGLVQITRKRVSDSLQKQLCDDCPTCQGSGFVYSPESVSHAIFRRLLKLSTDDMKRGVKVRAHGSVVDWLNQHEPELIQDLSRLAGRDIELETVHSFHPEQFEVGSLD